MDEDAIHTFLEAAKPTPYYPVFYMALFTSMGRPELLALRWCDVDLILGQISVSRSLHHLHDKSLIFRVPKTAKGRRIIALPPSAILVLKEHREKQEQIQLILGTRLEDSDLVFSQHDRRPLLLDTVNHAWTRLAQCSGMKGIRLHDARYSHASLILKQGVHPKIVQEQLDHAQYPDNLLIHIAT